MNADTFADLVKKFGHGEYEGGVVTGVFSSFADHNFTVAGKSELVSFKGEDTVPGAKVGPYS